MDETAVGIRTGNAHHIAQAVRDGLLHQRRISFRLRQERGTGNTFRGVFRAVEEMPLARAALLQHGSVRMAKGDERRACRRRDGFRQPVRTVGIRVVPPQHVRFPHQLAQQVVSLAFRRGHGPDVPARLHDPAESVPRVADDGFRRNDRFPIRDFRPRDFHQLTRRVVRVGSHDAVFVLFPQGAAAHHLPFRHSAIAPRALDPPVFLVIFVVRRIRQCPGSIRQQRIFLNARIISLRANIGHPSGTVPRHGFPADLHFLRLLVQGAVVRFSTRRT